MDGSALIIVLAALGLGAATGWFFGSRPAAEWKARHAARDSEARELDEKFRRAIAELAGASAKAERLEQVERELGAARDDHARQLEGLRTEQLARLDGLRTEHVQQLEKVRQDFLAQADAARRAATEQFDALRAEHTAAARELAALKANAENFAEQQRLLIEAKAALTKEFEAAGAKVLGQAQEAFLKRAEDRFSESEKASGERLRTLLAPVGERLKSYEEQVATLEKQRVDAFGQLNGQIEALRAGQELVRAEAARLGNSLRNAPKARGRWGEQQLRNVLEQCGLAEHSDFVTEHSVNTEEGRLRPDAIVRIPGNKLLVIDAKVSLNAYQDAFECEDELLRKGHLDSHATSMRNHIQMLGAKSYQSQFEEAPDYVLMFVPGEHFIAAALEHDPELWNFAFDRRVLLASPTNLVAIARTVAQVWRQDGLAKEAREIGRMGGELYDRLAVAAEHLKRVGSGLDNAVNNYNKFVGSFERNVLSAGRRLRDKHIEIGKREIEEVALVESAPRYGDAGADALLPAAEPANDEVAA